MSCFQRRDAHSVCPLSVRQSDGIASKANVPCLHSSLGCTESRQINQIAGPLPRTQEFWTPAEEQVDLEFPALAEEHADLQGLKDDIIEHMSHQVSTLMQILKKELREQMQEELLQLTKGKQILQADTEVQRTTLLKIDVPALEGEGNLSSAAVQQQQIPLEETPTFISMQKQMQEMRDAIEGLQLQQKQGIQLKENPEFDGMQQQIGHMQQQIGEMHLSIVELTQEFEGQKADNLSTVTLGNGETTGNGETIGKRESGISMESLVILDDVYQFEESTWPLVILFGGTLDTHDSLGFLGTINVIVGCLLYFTLASAFIGVGLTEFIEREYTEDTAREFTYWRATVSHDIANLNVVTGESLVSRLCRRDASLETSTLQYDAYLELDKYLADTTNISDMFLSGPALALLSVLVWTLSVDKEYRRCYRFFVALCLQTPHSDRTTICRTHDGYEVVEVRRLKKVVIAMMVLCRVTIVSFLTYFGVVWLAQEVSKKDMLLNCAALNIVLDFDELVYAALMPRGVKVFVANVEGIKMPPIKSFAGLDPATLWSNIFTLGFCAWALSLLLAYNVTITSNRDALCRGTETGSLDFVHAIDSIGIPWAAPSTHIDTSEQAIQASAYLLQSVDEFIREGFPSPTSSSQELRVRERGNTGPFILTGSPESLQHFRLSQPQFQHISQWTAVDLFEYDAVKSNIDELQILSNGGPDLGDLIESGVRSTYNRVLNGLLNSHSALLTCADVPDTMCQQEPAVRSLCARRCGCTSPKSGIFAGVTYAKTGVVGCPAWALSSADYQSELDNTPCEDTTQLTIFEAWASGLPSERADLILRFNTGQCHHVASYGFVGGALCRVTSLAAICPVTCGCAPGAWTQWKLTQEQSLLCPKSCNNETGVQNHGCVTIPSSSLPASLLGNDTYQLNGYGCSFPFVFNGRVYNKCTHDGWGSAWCRVVSRPTFPSWGYCPESCSTMDYLNS